MTLHGARIHTTDLLAMRLIKLPTVCLLVLLYMLWPLSFIGLHYPLLLSKPAPAPNSLLTLHIGMFPILNAHHSDEVL